MCFIEVLFFTRINKKNKSWGFNATALAIERLV